MQCSIVEILLGDVSPHSLTPVQEHKEASEALHVYVLEEKGIRSNEQ